MNITIPGFVFLLALLSTAPHLFAQENQQALPTADDVIAEYIEAVGSEMALHGIESIHLEADFDGLETRGDGKVVLNYHNGMWHYDFQLDDGQHTYIHCDDGSYWQNPDAWLEMSETNRVKFQEIVPVLNAPLRWLEYDGEIEVRGIEEVVGQKCYRLEFRPEGGDPVTRYFDVDTKLLMRMTYSTNGRTADWFLSDYQEIEGFAIPMKREQFFGDEISYVVNTKKVILNEEIDDDLFKRPEIADQAPKEPDDPFGDG